MNKVVIVGGGIAGCASAFYLSKRGVSCVVVEAVAIASAASGKAGGFLANWPAGGETAGLHKRGMELHERLARELELGSYRKLETLEVAMGRNAGREGPDWLLRGSSVMDHNAAQVDPREVTTKLFEASGARLVRAAATGVKTGADRVTVLLDNGDVLSGSHVVLALGPWMPVAEAFFEGASFPMKNPASASLVYRARPVLHHALFCSMDQETGTHLELYPRPNGDLYVCGVGMGGALGSSEMKSLAPAANLKPLPHRVEAAKRAVRKIVREDELRGEEPVEQVCLRPCFVDAMPAIGVLRDKVLVVGGGNCWGICWGPAMGECIAELLCDGKSTLDIARFDPRRFE